MPARLSAPPTTRGPAGAQPTFRRATKFQPKPVRPPLAPRVVRYVLMLAAVVIIIDALFGDRGFLDTVQARRDYAALEAHVSRVRADNARLREEARRLKEDPLAVETIARDKLGLIYPGEMLFIVRDHTVHSR